MDPNIFQKFSDNLKKVLVLAEKIAKDSGKQMDSEELLLALSTIKGTLSADILANFEITPERLQIISKLVASNSSRTRVNGISKSTKEIIQIAILYANQYRHSIVDCEHLLLALVSKKDLNSYSIIERIGVKPEKIRIQIESIFKEISRATNTQGFASGNTDQGINEEQIYDMQFDNAGGTAVKESEKTTIEQYTTNLTLLAKKRKLDPLIGRKDEIDRVIQILSRRNKNNPLLVGEPGVGKTAIVEGLAQRIIEGTVPNNLIGSTILSLDIASLLAGTIYRGQFEARLKKLLSEIKSTGNNLLFIDEIHTTVGTGSAEGSLDTANILKPIISKGEIKIIGATTFEEYKRYIEKDPAYERRFQAVKVNQTTKKETLKILQGLKKNYELHHNIKFTQKSLEAAVELSDRYISDRFLPDKAIDLIDEAAAATNIIGKNSIKINKLNNQLIEVLENKDEAVSNENYEAATHLREEEIKLTDKINQLKALADDERKKEITEKEIAEVVSRWTGVDIENLTFDERKKYQNLDSKISKKIVGQDYAIEKITKAIRRNRVGVSDPKRPIGSFLFLGPTGVGKTYLTKVLAELLFGSEDNLVKIDMSEFMEKHNISRLIGAPAGYVGYDDGGKLTEMVRQKPYSIILFDEIEKAHPEVFNILLQILEDGYLTDAKGRRVNFRNTIIILTSNLGTSDLNRNAAIGFNATSKKEIRNAEEKFKKIEKEIQHTIKKELRPEFINRLDDIIIFKPLNQKVIEKIVNLNIRELVNRLKKRGVKLSVSVKAKKYLAKIGYSDEYGARPIRRAISNKVEDKISDIILSDDIKDNQEISVDLTGDKLSIRVVSKRKG